MASNPRLALDAAATLRHPRHFRARPLAALLITLLTTIVLRAKPSTDASGTYPTLAQQHTDALETALTAGIGSIDTELILHIRGDGATTNDGTPIADTVIARIAPTAFLRVMIHDADSRPINASGRHRHPTKRQKLVVKERDQVCIDCGRGDLLEYDHVPAYQTTGRTIINELQLRCAPCHHHRHHHTN